MDARCAVSPSREAVAKQAGWACCAADRGRAPRSGNRDEALFVVEC